MRYLELITEDDHIEQTRYSQGCRVHHVKSRAQLDGLIERYGVLRGMMFDDVIDVWDAEKATHGAYETTFGDMGGYRLMISNHSLEINIYDYQDRDNPNPEFLDCPMIARIFPDIDSWKIANNEL